MWGSICTVKFFTPFSSPLQFPYILCQAPQNIPMPQCDPALCDTMRCCVVTAWVAVELPLERIPPLGR